MLSEVLRLPACLLVCADQAAVSGGTAQRVGVQIGKSRVVSA